MLLKDQYIKQKKYISLQPYIEGYTLLVNSSSDSPLGKEVPLVVMEYSKSGNLHKMILPVLLKLIQSISLAMKS